MPTTIYDSSLITQRKRDKVVAQQVMRRNDTGVRIMTPQSGYDSYTIANIDNGDITQYSKREGVVCADKACACDELSAIMARELIPNVMTIVSDQRQVSTLSFTLDGSGVIDWGDGNTEEYDFTSGQQVINHTYGVGIYTITITSSNLLYFNAAETPIANIINIPYNIQSVSLTNTNITGNFDFDGYNNLLYLFLSGNPITVSNLPTSLREIDLSDTSITGEFDFTGYNNLTQLQLSDNPITVSNLPTSLQLLYLSNTSITGNFDFTGYNNLINLALSGNPITVSNLPNSLEVLRLDNTNIIGNFNFNGYNNLTELVL